MRTRLAIGLSLAALVLAADIGSKYWILHVLDLPSRGDVPLLPPLLDLAMVWNHGVTFGLLLWLRRAENLAVAASIGAIAGGALGNVADRIRYGMVVDFIHVHWGAFDPFPFVFNLGDSAIVLGVAALLVEGLFPARSRLQAPPPKA